MANPAQSSRLYTIDTKAVAHIFTATDVYWKTHFKRRLFKTGLIGNGACIVQSQHYIF